MARVKDSPRRRQEVQRRARRIMERQGWGYGKAMRRAGWLVAHAVGDKRARA